MVPQDFVVVRIERQIVLLRVRIQVVCPQNFGNFDKLVKVVGTLEKGLLFEDHASKHAPQRPDV